jgi:hypothetical protein
VEFSWEGNPDFFYTLCYATDPDFPPGNTSTITCQGRALQNDSYPMYGITGFFLLILMAGNPGKIKSIGTILVCGLLLLSCTKEKSSGQDEPMSWTQTITDLQPGSTYYWKINSHPISSEDFWSETVIRSFTTGTLEQVN